MKANKLLSFLFLIPFCSGCTTRQADAERYCMNAESKEKNGDYKEAKEDYDTAIKLDPKYPYAYLGRAGVKQYFGDLRGAIEDCDIFIKQASQITDTHTSAYYRARVYAYRGRLKSDLNVKDLKGALDDYNNAIKIADRELYDVYYSRALVKSELGDKKGALEDFEKWIKHNHFIHSGGYYNQWGEAKFYMGDIKSAIENYDTAIMLYPNYAYDEAYNNRAIAKLKLGDKTGACEDWNKASELGDKEVNDSIEKYCK